MVLAMGWFSKSSRSEEVAEFHDSSLASLIVQTELQQLSLANSSALSVAAIYRARQILSDSLSALPLLTATDSLVPAPNADQTTQDFVAELVLSMEDSGDGYVHVTSEGMRVLPHERMVVTWDGQRALSRKRVYKYENQIMRTGGVAPNLAVVSVNRTASDLTGLGWLESGVVTKAIAINEYTTEYFANNGQPTGILKVPQAMSEPEAKLLKKQWDRNHQIRQTAVISQAMDYEPTSFNANDSEMVASNLASIGDIANASGVPSYLLAYSPPGSTQDYQNVESVLVRLWRETIHPTYARRIEAMYTHVFGTLVKFDPEEMFLSSLAVRTTSVGELVRAGFDPATAADIVGLPPIEHTGFLPITLQGQAVEEGAKNAIN